MTTNGTVAKARREEERRINSPGSVRTDESLHYFSTMKLSNFTALSLTKSLKFFHRSHLTSVEVQNTILQ